MKSEDRASTDEMRAHLEQKQLTAQAWQQRLAEAKDISDEDHAKAVHAAQRCYNEALALAVEKGLRVELETITLPSMAHPHGAQVRTRVWREIQP